MTAIWTRSALVYWGKNPAPDVARLIVDRTGRHVFTWRDLFAERKRRQERSLAFKRHSRLWRAFKVWVAYYDMDLFGGWQAFVENRDGCHWIDRDRRGLISPLMEMFPLVLDLQSRSWQQWKVEFAKQYQRRTHDRRPVGVAYVWMKDQQIRRAAK